MHRTVNTTNHRLRPHGLRSKQLVADYESAHPGRLAARAAARLRDADTVPFPAVQAPFPSTVGLQKIVLRAGAPLPVVAR